MITRRQWLCVGWIYGVLGFSVEVCGFSQLAMMIGLAAGAGIVFIGLSTCGAMLALSVAGLLHERTRDEALELLRETVCMPPVFVSAALFIFWLPKLAWRYL